ncbi:hypothetical protein WJX72_000125 [[Myrmecia] bisecta]|uniref:Uncharacterized protein n=1 Tax=[Myrmecia] bisecta TaxID=41462 RepID=A0AAW1R4K4_9CHLO
MVLARGLHFPRVVEASYFSHSGRASATVYKLNRIVDSIIYAYTASVIHRRTPQPTSDTLRLVYTAGMLIQLLALSTAHIFPRTLVLYHEAIKVFVQTCSFFTLYVSHTLIVSCKHRSVFPLVLIAMMPGWNFLPGQVRVSTFGPVLVLQLFAWLPLDAWSREKLIIYFDFPKQGLADRLMRAATLFLLCQVVPMLVGSWLEVKARRAYLASHHPTMEWTPTGPWAAILRLLRMRVGQAGVPENEPSLSGTHALLHSRGKMEASGDYAAAGPSVAAKSIQTEVEVERQVHARLQRDFERSQQELQVAQRREEQLVAANACLGRQLEALTGIKQVLSLRQAAIQDQVASLVQDRMYMRAENLALQQKLAEVSSQASDSAAALSTVLRELQHLQATAAGERRGVWHSVLTALGLDPASLEAPSADQQERIEHDSGESGSSGDEAGSTSESGSGGRSRQGGRGNGAAVDQASSSPEIAAREWADLWALKCRQEQQWGEALWRCHQQLTTHLRRFAQVFQQTGQADKDLAAVRARHEAHQNAERDVLEARAVAATAGRDATRDAALLSISALIAQQQELRAVLRDARWLLQAAFPSRVLDSLNLTPLTRHCMGPDVHGVVDAEMVAWLQQLGVPAELVTGGQSLPSQQWLERLQQWLASHCLQEATSGSCSDPGQQTAQLCVAFETLLQGALKHCQRAVFSAAQDSAQVLARLTALQASHAELQHMQQVDQHILDIMRQDRQALLTEIAVVQQCLDMSICNVCMGPMTANSRATSSAA